jgi:hypothetical protein
LKIKRQTFGSSINLTANIKTVASVAGLVARAQEANPNCSPLGREDQQQTTKGDPNTIYQPLHTITPPGPEQHFVLSHGVSHDISRASASTKLAPQRSHPHIPTTAAQHHAHNTGMTWSCFTSDIERSV